MVWTDARRPVPRSWVRSSEVRGGGGGGETSLSELEHTTNNKVGSLELRLSYCSLQHVNFSHLIFNLRSI